MNNSEAIVTRYFWNDDGTSLYVLYSDNFWKQYLIPGSKYSHLKNGKTRNTILDFRKMSQKKMSQDEAEAYIDEKIKQYEELKRAE